jgi:Carboxypeptidase regulatory-like domain/TonB dependent receptor-like, beta-barrel/TonB-dependent Receptor Plug Domain
MRFRTFCLLIMVALLAWPVAAQEQRGSIQGVVRDSSGAVLPGATVEARSAGSGVLSTVSGPGGSFRFPSVLPGAYEVSATLSGFKPAKVSDVMVTLGSVKSVEFSLQLASVTEAVTVTAESPIVDTKSSAKSTNIRAEQIDLLPHNRDFLSLVTQAAGVNDETKSASAGNSGIMIDGAAAAENRYVIDGIETTNIIGGLSGKNLVADFVEEVQIKSSGYAAEYGGSTGGVINALTKSGTNAFHGAVLGYYQGSRLAGDSNPTLRAVFGVPTQAEYHTYPKDKNDRFEPGVSLGGPVFRDQMWFFGAYQPARTKITRTVNPQTSGIASATPSVTTQKQEVQYATANVTNQFGNKLRTRVAYNNSWSKTDGVNLATQNGSDPASTSYAKGTKFPNYSVSGTADYTVSSSVVLGARAGRYSQDTHDFNVNNVVRFLFADGTTNIGMPDVPEQFQHPAGYNNVNNNSGTDFDTQTRNFLQADATWFARMGAGTHQVKGGIQFDRRENNVITGELQNLISLRWGVPYTGGDTPVSGPFGYYEVRGNAVAPQQGFITQGDVRSDVTGLFVQDTWSVSNRLTINAGVRTEKENVPAYTTDPTVTPNPIKFGWGDKFAPRVGASYDLKGDGRTKIYGSWGVFYDIFKLNMPRGSFGGDKWISYYYTLDQANFETLRDSPNCPPACPGTFLASVDFRAPSVKPGLDVEEPGQLKPMKSQEFSLGFERQLGTTMAATVRFIHKQLDRAIDDIGDLCPPSECGAGAETYIIANPGEGLVEQFDISTGTSLFKPQGFGSNPVLITMPKASRNYDAVELRLERRFRDNWLLNGSYMWSRDAGNYSGLSSSDEVNATGNGRVNPNNSRDYDYPAMVFDQHADALDGVLDTDRTHQVKLSGLYLFKWGTSVGLNQQIFSGTPITRQVPIIAPDNYPIRYRGRASDGRMPVFLQSDLFVQHAIRVGGSKEIQVNLTVLNLFNRNAALNKVTTIRRTGAIPLGEGYYTEAGFYAGQLDFDQLIAKSVADGRMTLNPQFLLANAFQAPISARFGVRFSF